MEKIIVENLTKIFGAHPKKAMSLLQKDETRESILEKTGMTVGVNNVNQCPENYSQGITKTC